MRPSYLKNPALISIGANTGQILLIKKMKELGYSVIAIDRDPIAPGFEFSDESLFLSTHDADPIITELGKLEGKYKLRGVFTRSSGPPVVTTAIIAEHFGFPGSTEKAASVIVNKGRLMKLCQLNGIVNPLSTPVTDSHYYNSISKQLPCIVKPALSLVGKKGVRLIREKHEINSAFKMAKHYSHTGDVLIERYIPGDDIGLISFVLERKVYPVVLLQELNEFSANGEVVAKGVEIPYNTTDNLSQLIHSLAQSIVDLTGVENSPFLLSCRYSNESVLIPIEIHLDFGGDLILDELLPASSDFDFIKFTLKAIVERQPQTPDAIFKPATLELKNYTKEEHL